MKIFIGATLKKLRIEKNLSIRDLAAQADISPASLSNIERNINSPTLDSLAKICEALDIHMIDLLQHKESEEKIVTKKQERKTLSTEGTSKIVYELATPPNKNFKFLYITMEPYCDYGYTAKNYPSDEICFVLEGKMEVLIEEKSYILEEGDTIYIKAETRYKYRNIGSKNSVSLWALQGSNTFYNK